MDYAFPSNRCLSVNAIACQSNLLKVCLAFRISSLAMPRSMDFSAEFDRYIFDSRRICFTYRSRYSRMDQVKFVEDSLFHFRFLKGFLSQILLGPFLNTLAHMSILLPPSKGWNSLFESELINYVLTSGSTKNISVNFDRTSS